MHIAKLNHYYHPRYMFFYEPQDIRQPLQLAALGWDRVAGKTYRQITNKWKDNKFFLRYTLSGRGEIKIENQIFELTPGLAFMIKTPNDIMFYLPETSSHWEFIYIELAEPGERWYSDKVVPGAGTVLDFDKNDPIIRQLFYIYSKARLDEIPDVYTASHLAYHFMMVLLQRFDKKKPESDFSELQIASAIQHMNENILTADLKSTARSLRITKYHLIRLFKQHTGMTPNEYLTSIRIKEAMGLLQHTRYNLDRIAAEVGYSHANYLCRVFKKQLGMTPNEFRRELEASESTGF